MRTMIMSEKNMKRKMEEALEVGNKTLESLHFAQIKLDSARSWVVLEGFGGSFLTSMMKNMKISDTQTYVEQAKQDILKFQVMLKSISLPEDVKRRCGVFISFATFFLDGTVDDYMVKSRVDSAQEQIRDAIQIVDEVCEDLTKWCAMTER